MIYRRNAHGSDATRLTTTIPLHNSSHSDALHQQQHQHHHHHHLRANTHTHDLHDLDDAHDKDNGAVDSFFSRWLRCHGWRRRKPVAKSMSSSSSSSSISPSSSSALRRRIGQIVWRALLVYAFFGLPVLGRILNIVRHLHRFSVASITLGVGVGFLQDVAIFVQASTLIVILKAVRQPQALQRRLSIASVPPPPPSSSSSSLGQATATSSSSFVQERYPHQRYVHLPVYFPVRTNEYEIPPASTTAESDVLDPSTATPPKHLTLVASSSSTLTSFPWSFHSSAPSTPATPAIIALATAKTLLGHSLFVLGVQVVLLLATVTSVVDFCLQVAMHPRLNRAYVKIFFNYMAPLTASLTDKDMLSPTMTMTWASYIVLMIALAFAFTTERLPFLPELLRRSPPSSSPSSSPSSGCVARLSHSCCAMFKRRSSRKDSSLSATVDEAAAPSKPKGFISSLYQSYWRRKDADVVIVNELPAYPRGGRRRRGNSYGHGGLLGGPPSTTLATRLRLWSSTSSSTSASTSLWMAPTTPLGVVLHCLVVSVFVTLAALTASLIVHSSTHQPSRTSYGWTVDVKLMANPMFALETEPFFTHSTRVGTDRIDCKAASAKLLSTLGSSEVYELDGLGNDDACALLWRKTTGFQGDTLWDINWNLSSSSSTLSAEDGNTTMPSETQSFVSSNAKPPNIIVLNMESWRSLDVGVLGGAAKRAQFNRSATPQFDRLSREGILYRKHYTPCIQTARTLLTTLFGVLPSCTETTALKRFGTSLTVRGLPQFLKARSYFNLFWRAVDLTWESWDQFLSTNGFDKLVDDRKVRQMLHEARSDVDRENDHFSWGIHDRVSFEMLLYAIESARNHSVSANVSGVQHNGSLASVNASAPIDGVHVDEEEKDDVPSARRIRRDVVHSKHKTASTPLAEPVASVHGHENVMTSSSSSEMSKPVGWEGLREPFFIDMYTTTSHNPWTLPVDYAAPDLTELSTRFNKRYLDSIYFSDAMLGKFIDGLRAKGLMKNTIVIIQGDHGDGWLEHGNNPSVAASGVYDEAAHVPFLLLADDFLSATAKGTTVDQLTMQSDLMTTIADVLGVSEAQPLVQHGLGHSMRRKRSPPAPVENVGFEAIRTTNVGMGQDKERHVLLCNPFNGLTKGVRTEELKYVFHPDGSYQVFKLADDPGEKRPVHAGYDRERMGEHTQSVLATVTELVDLHQFLYETNKFTAPLPSSSSSPSSTSSEPLAMRNVVEMNSEVPMVLIPVEQAEVDASVLGDGAVVEEK